MHKAIITPIIALCAIEAIAHTTDSIKSQPSAIEITIGSAIGLATNAATTEVLKYSIHEMRPDGSGNNSFPSRHSSWAFAASTLASNYLSRHSPWYSLGAQFIATGIGAQRIVARRHYASDVVAGSLLGIASAELGTFVARKIFGSGSGLSFYDVENDFRTTVSMNTGAAYPLGSPSDAHLCAAYMAAVRAAIPIDGRWGVSASVRSFFTPVRYGAEVHPLTAAGISAGAVTHLQLPLPALALQPHAEIGASWLTGAGAWRHSRMAFTAETGCTLSWRLTENFATGATASFGLMTLPRAIGTFNVSISSVAVF